MLQHSPPPDRREHPRVRRNNFNTLRLLLAALLVLTHAMVLSGDDALPALAAVFSTPLRVQTFFVISGFLVFRSYERSRSVGDYAFRRIHRLYPAYCVVVLASAVLLFAVSSRGVDGYFTRDWVKYVTANLVFLNFAHPTLPGVFEAHRMHEVNGALWTMKIEVMFYLTVPVLVYLCRRLGYFVVLSATYALAVVYVMVMTWLAATTGADIYVRLGRQLPGQLSYLTAGAFFYYYLPLLEKHLVPLVMLAVAVLAVNVVYALPVLHPLALAIAVMFIGLFIQAPDLGRLGELSYGIFISHFPIIQVVIATGWFARSPALYLTTVLIAVCLCAEGVARLTAPRVPRREPHAMPEAERLLT